MTHWFYLTFWPLHTTTFYLSQFGVWGVMVSLGWSGTNSLQLSRLARNVKKLNATYMLFMYTIRNQNSIKVKHELY